MKKIHFEDLCLRLTQEKTDAGGETSAGHGDPLLAGACRRYLAAEGYDRGGARAANDNPEKDPR